MITHHIAKFNKIKAQNIFEYLKLSMIDSKILQRKSTNLKKLLLFENGEIFFKKLYKTIKERPKDK